MSDDFRGGTIELVTTIFSFVMDDEGEDLPLMLSISAAGRKMTVGVLDMTGDVGDDRLPGFEDERSSAKEGWRTANRWEGEDGS